MILETIKRLRANLDKHWRLGRWNPWAVAEGQRTVDAAADRIAVSVQVLWIVCVPFTVWMAFGEPPSWLAWPVIIVLWVFAIFQLLAIGLPPLIAPFFLIWLAFPGNLKKAEQWNDPQEEWEEGYDEHVKLVDAMKAEGVLPEDHEIPPKSREEFDDYIERTWPDRPGRRLTIRIAGVILIAALVLSGRPVLAAVFALPPLGWYALDGLLWAVQRWRGG